MKILVHILGTTLAVLLASHVVPGFSITGSFYTALIIALVLGVLNVTIKPILSILTLPLNIITLGLFSFVINAVLLLLIARFVPDFHIEGFLPALVGGAVIAVVGWVLHRIT